MNETIAWVIAGGVLACFICVAVDIYILQKINKIVEYLGEEYAKWKYDNEDDRL